MSGALILTRKVTIAEMMRVCRCIVASSRNPNYCLLAELAIACFSTQLCMCCCHACATSESMPKTRFTQVGAWYVHCMSMRSVHP